MVCRLKLSKATGPAQPQFFLSRKGMAAAVQAKNISDMITSMESQRPRITPALPIYEACL